MHKMLNKPPSFLSFSWISENILLILTLFLIAFIPLWPKIPLFQPIPGYIVRVRIEDCVVAGAAIIWLAQLIRQKIRFRTPLNISIGFYLLVTFISLLSAMFWIKTFPLLWPHIAKAFLTWVRYIEYFSLFFFVIATLKKRVHIHLFLNTFFLVIVLAGLYGVGQKYWRWPVYSTMNWEFSKGIPLELASQYARVQSTFAGHYDFAIYMALVLPFVLATLFATKQKKVHVLLGLVLLIGIWSLIVSGLRSAFVSFLLSVAVTTIVMAMHQSGLMLKIKWASWRLLIIYGVTAVMFLLFGSNLQALLNHAVTGVFLPKRDDMATDETIISQYELPVPIDQVNQTPPPLSTPKPQQLSGCAKEREISLCIRLESLWPQAIKGFEKQPLLGSGFSTLNKRDFNHLAEADGVDNNYLRILGETGLLGFIAFFSILFCSFTLALKNVFSQDQVARYIAAAYLGALISLLFNAILFDVFAASKIAFTFWALTGVVVAYWQNGSPVQNQKKNARSANS